MGYTIDRIGGAEWRLLREIRLSALLDAPYAFGATWKDEAVRDDAWWVLSADRLAWFVARNGDEIAGLIAGKPIEDGDPCLREIISMWVASQYRGQGVAEKLVAAVLSWASEGGA